MLDDTLYPYLRAAKHGDVAMMQCLRRVGCPLPRDGGVFREAVEEDCGLEVLQWMVEQGFPVDWDGVEELDKDRRAAWRHKWNERSLWIHGMWQQAKAQEGELAA